MLEHLDLFSGIGGFSLASKWVGGINTSQFVEIDPWCRRLLNQNFPKIPTHDDIATYTVRLNQFDLFTAGFPCQDLSVAGNQRGISENTRSGLFYEVVRLVRECRPRYVLLENVPAILSSNKGRDMGSVLWDFSQLGYSAEWQTISAESLGANHTRNRWWFIAYPNSIGHAIEKWEKRGEIQQWGILSPNQKGEKLRSGFQRSQLDRSPRFSDIAKSTRRNDGLPGGVDVAQRLKALGNAIVPQVAEIPLCRIVEIERRLQEKR